MEQRFLTRIFAKSIGTALLAFSSHSALADIRLPQLVSNGMVLQRDQKVKLWGWAAPGEKVKIVFLKRGYRAIAGPLGNWAVELPTMAAGGPYQMEINGHNHIELSNLFIGDVFFFSGQSNMTVMMERVKERYPQEISGADLPQVHYFFVPTSADVSRVHDDLPIANWVPVDREHILTIGAVPYFFAKQIYAKYHVPLGLINSSVGGTPIQAWISSDGLKDLQPYAARLTQLHDTAFINASNRPSGNKPSRSPPQSADSGLSGTLKWYDPAYDASRWHAFWMPGYWADQGVRGLNGVVWFRKEVELPVSMTGNAAKLFVGRIVDADETYVNGVKVGNITYQYPPRRYDIPQGLLKAGKNIIVVRVTNIAGKGGFVPDKRYELTDGLTSIDLRGDWKYQVGEVYSPRGGNNFSQSARINAQNEPAGLYNTMIAPAINYSVKGFLWYQGEANADNPADYQKLMTALINNWRSAWREPNAPFFFVQLPNYMEVQYTPSESNWAQLREAQRQTLTVQHTAMAVTIDVGEWNDIHPLDKKDVGERLALAAQRMAYGDTQVVWSGPTVKSAQRDDKNIILTFDNTGSGLIAKDDNDLQQFAIAGADKRFFWAKAKIDGNRLIINSYEVADPIYVRYAWADNPQGANLYNREGLPASPFMIEAHK